MSVQDIADFEAQLQKLCEFWKAKLSLAELAGTMDNVKTIMQIERYQELVKPEMCETPIVKDEQANAPVTHQSERERVARTGGASPPIEIGNGASSLPVELPDFNTPIGIKPCDVTKPARMKKHSASPIPAEVENA